MVLWHFKGAADVCTYPSLTLHHTAPYCTILHHTLTSSPLHSKGAADVCEYPESTNEGYDDVEYAYDDDGASMIVHGTVSAMLATAAAAFYLF